MESCEILERRVVIQIHNFYGTWHIIGVSSINEAYIHHTGSFLKSVNLTKFAARTTAYGNISDYIIKSY